MPTFLARVIGISSIASANFSITICSLPTTVVLCSLILFAIIASVEPPPRTINEFSIKFQKYFQMKLLRH